MKGKRARLFGPLELEIMKVVWERGDVTVAEVVEELRPAKDLHHNTVMTVMRRLARKGVLERYARDGRTHGYRPRVAREEVCRQYIELVKEQFFGGSASETIAALLGSEKLTPRKRSNLNKLLTELEEM